MIVLIGGFERLRWRMLSGLKLGISRSGDRLLLFYTVFPFICSTCGVFLQLERRPQAQCMWWPFVCENVSLRTYTQMDAACIVALVALVSAVRSSGLNSHE